MLDSIWMIIAIPLGFIMNGCYLFIKDVLHLPVPYLFALLLLTLITKALLYPLSLRQQRITAKASAYKPMIDEINQKYARDRQRQGDELKKLEREFGYKPAMGGFQLLVQMPIIFGLIDVINKPLSYMLRLSKDLVTALTEATAGMITDVTGLSAAEAAEKISFTLSGRNIETAVVEQVKNNAGVFSDIVGSNPAWAGEMQKIANLDLSIGSVNLYDLPRLEWSWMLLIPLISLVTTVLSSYISMKNSAGFQERGSMRSGITMMALSGVMFALFAFIFPVGFSLYWGISNILIIAQSYILKRKCNAAEIIAAEQQKIAAKKQAEADAKKVRIEREDGTVEIKELSDEEIAEARLLRARARDAALYGMSDAEAAARAGQEDGETL